MGFMNQKVREDTRRYLLGRALGNNGQAVVGYRLYLAMRWNALCSARIVTASLTVITTKCNNKPEAKVKIASPFEYFEFSNDAFNKSVGYLVIST